MRFVTVSPAEPAAAALLASYFAEREATFPSAGGYVVKPPDPAGFVPPAGVFLRLDDDSGAPIGCGGIRRIEPDAAGARLEIKHLFVAPAGRGLGAGRALLAELERRAVELDAATIVLDTNASLEAAGRLYRSTGYMNIPPYNDNVNATDWFAKPATRKPLS